MSCTEQFIHTSLSYLPENLSMKSNQVNECSERLRGMERNRERTKVRCNFLVSPKLPVKPSLVLIGLATQFLNLSQTWRLKYASAILSAHLPPLYRGHTTLQSARHTAVGDLRPAIMSRLLRLQYPNWLFCSFYAGSSAVKITVRLWRVTSNPH